MSSRIKPFPFAPVAAAAALVLACAFAAKADEAHQYDPCAPVSQKDAASAFGVATDQVFKPQAATKNECAWAVAAHTGVPGQQAAFTLQTIDQVKQGNPWQKFTTVLSAVRQIPGVPITDSKVNMIFDNAQTVADLGDKASWKNRTLSVVKKQLLLQVQVSSNGTDDDNLKIAKSIAKSALDHLPTDTPQPAAT